MYNYRSWKGGIICIESSAESREYMLTYFWEKGTYFYWGDGLKSLGDEYPPSHLDLHPLIYTTMYIIILKFR